MICAAGKCCMKTNIRASGRRVLTSPWSKVTADGLPQESSCITLVNSHCWWTTSGEFIYHPGQSSLLMDYFRRVHISPWSIVTVDGLLQESSCITLVNSHYWWTTTSWSQKAGSLLALVQCFWDFPNRIWHKHIAKTTCLV